MTHLSDFQVGDVASNDEKSSGKETAEKSSKDDEEVNFSIFVSLSNKKKFGGGQQSTEVAYLPLTQQPRF